MTRKNLRLLGYGRVSDVRGREGASFISPAEQSERMRAYATAYGHSIIEEGLELDRSGGDKTRPIFSDFMAKIESGEADGIIVAKLDRFARSNALAFSAIEAIEDAGGVLISVAEQIDTSGYAGKYMRAIFLATAAMERDRIGEQWLVARGRAVDRGIHVSRHVPPGYTKLPKSNDEATDRRLVPDPVHADTVREAFRMAASGEPYVRIAHHLTDHKLPVGGNGESHWGSNRIKRLLANRAYLGEARSGKGMVNPAAHKPLVDQTTWSLAQRAQAPALTENVETLLAGLCRCASCSFSMRSQKQRGNTVAAYRCSTNSVHGRCPGPSTISLSRLEEHVVSRFLDRASMTLQVVEDTEDDELAEATVEAERSYRAVLLDTDLRRQIGDTDHAALVAKLHKEWQDALSVTPVPRRQEIASSDLRALVTELKSRGDVRGLRELLASAIQAVFVRPATSRANNLPIEDRVRIIWQDDERLDLPRRGERFERRSFTW